MRGTGINNDDHFPLLTTLFKVEFDRGVDLIDITINDGCDVELDNGLNYKVMAKRRVKICLAESLVTNVKGNLPKIENCRELKGGEG